MSSTVRRYFAPAAPLDWRSVNDTRPITFPLLSTTGPPLSPGSMFAWISMSLLVPSVLMLLTLPNTFVGVVTPVCSAVVEEPGYPSAVTASPLVRSFAVVASGTVGRLFPSIWRIATSVAANPVEFSTRAACPCGSVDWATSTAV